MLSDASSDDIAANVVFTALVDAGIATAVVTLNVMIDAVVASGVVIEVGAGVVVGLDNPFVAGGGFKSLTRVVLLAEKSILSVAFDEEFVVVSAETSKLKETSDMIFLLNGLTETGGAGEELDSLVELLPNDVDVTVMTGVTDVLSLFGFSSSLLVRRLSSRLTLC